MMERTQGAKGTGLLSAPVVCRVLLPLFPRGCNLQNCIFSAPLCYLRDAAWEPGTEGYAECPAHRAQFLQYTCLPSSDREEALDADMGLQQTAMNVVLQVLPHPALETSGLIWVVGQVGSVPKGLKGGGGRSGRSGIKRQICTAPRRDRYGN